MDQVFVVNPGSSSNKYGLFAGATERASAYFEHTPKGFDLNLVIDGRAEKSEVSKKDFEHAVEYLLERFEEEQLVTAENPITAIGIRVVAPGSFFQAHHRINAKVVAALTAAQERAPLHITPVLSEISTLREHFPKLPMYGVSDSEFHASMPQHARIYGIPYADTKKHDLYRFGYHGISMSSVVHQLRKDSALKARCIVCHLGSGASTTALLKGESQDTTMGYTPLEGLVMSTRGGDVDAGAVLYLQQKLALGREDMESYLYREGGLKGLSGESPDLRELIAGKQSHDEPATRAIDLYTYRVRKYVGAYAAVLGGLDQLVFAGTVGERSWIMRQWICRELASAGIKLEPSANVEHEGKAGVISADGSEVEVRVVVTDEMAEIARLVGEQT